MFPVPVPSGIGALVPGGNGLEVTCPPIRRKWWRSSEWKNHANKRRSCSRTTLSEIRRLVTVVQLPNRKDRVRQSEQHEEF